jgi:hypothetical protein
MKKCELIVERKTSNKLFAYDADCGRVAKYRIEFNEATRGRRKEVLVCGIHKNSIIAMCNRINNMVGRDFTNTKIKFITTPKTKTNE